MKKRFLLLLTALFVLVASTMSVQADVTIKQYLKTITGEDFYGKDIPTNSSKNKGSLAQTTTSDVTVVDDGSGDYVFRFTGVGTARQDIVLITYNDEKAVNKEFYVAPYQIYTARIKLSSVDSELRLFVYDNNFANDLKATSDTSGVYINGGGAYYVDAQSNSRVPFAEPGTIKANKWYTVRTVYDISVNKQIVMSAEIYDENNALVAFSPMQNVSTLSQYKTGGYFRNNIVATGFEDGDYALIDDISMYYMSELPVLSCNNAEYDNISRKVTFTFAEPIDTNIISASNVRVIPDNSSLDATGKYSVSITDDKVVVDTNLLPYDEKFTVQIGSYAMESACECKITTPEDPFEKAVTNVTFEAADGEAIAAGDNVVTTVSLENNSNTGRDYMLLVTSWNSKNECVAIRNVAGYIDIGADPVIKLPAVPFEDAGSIIRVSLLDNWYNMTPVGDVVTFELGGK